MTLDAEGDDPVTLRVDCGEAALAPSFTLMDVIELMGVPGGRSASGRWRGRHRLVAVAPTGPPCRAPGSRCPSPRPAAGHVRNVAQWAELRARNGGASAHAWAPPAGPPPRSRQDMKRGRFLGAEEAVGYGIVDEVCRPDAAVTACRGRARRRSGSGRCADGRPERPGRPSAGPISCLRCGRLTTTRPRPICPPPPLAAGEWDERLTRVLEIRPGGPTSRCTSSRRWAGPTPSCSGAGSASAVPARRVRCPAGCASW